MQFQPEGLSRSPQASCSCLGKGGIGRVDEECNDARGGEKLVQQFQPLRATSSFNWVAPVMLPLGRLSLSTSPSLIGSPPVWNTIGITVVAALAARAAGVLIATITVTCRCTRSAAIRGSRSYRPSAHRYSILMLSPSM